MATTRLLSGDDARLDRLINDEGLNQLTASQILWAPHLVDTTVDEPVHRRLVIEQARAEGRRIVRDGLADVLDWLRRAS